MSKTAGLLRRGARWYVKVSVPRPLRAKVGRSEIVETLGTGDLDEAVRLRDRKRAEVRDRIERLARGTATKAEQPGYLLDTVRHILADKLDEHQAYAVLSAAIEKHHGPHADDDDSTDTSEARLAYARLGGTAGLLLSEAIRDHLADLDGTVTASWRNAKERELRGLREWLKRDIAVTELSRRMLSEYVGKTINASAGAPVTRRNRIAALVSFGSWLVDHGHLEANPMARLTRTVREPRRADVTEHKRAYTPAELLQVLQELRARLPVGDPLLSVVAIGAFTGARTEEICALKVADVAADRFSITRAKNANSIRTVPLHACISALVGRLRESGTDYLIPGLQASGTDEKRSHSLSTRYRRWLDRLGLPPNVDAHSLRRSFMQRCEDAGIPVSSVKLLVGHARSGLTFGLYSAGPEWQRLVDAMGKVSYGAEVDALVKSL